MAWRPKYKQLCAICRKDHVLMTTRGQFPICTACSMREISKPIEDEKFRKMFDIEQALYEKSSFLRSIKGNYLRFGGLSDKQIETFKKVVEELRNPRPPEPAAGGGEEKEETVKKVVKARKPKATSRPS